MILYIYYMILSINKPAARKRLTSIVCGSLILWEKELLEKL